MNFQGPQDSVVCLILWTLRRIRTNPVINFVYHHRSSLVELAVDRVNTVLYMYIVSCSVECACISILGYSVHFPVQVRSN